MYTDSDPKFLAPTRSLEIGQECLVFSTCQPGNPIGAPVVRPGFQLGPAPCPGDWRECIQCTE